MRGHSTENKSSNKHKQDITDTLVFVHDAPGLFAGLPLILPGVHYTTPLVIEEVRDLESRERLKRALETGKLNVKKPSGTLVKKEGLSEADVSILTLALELSKSVSQVVVVTDDYRLQKAAREAGLEYMPVKTIGYEKADSILRKK